LLAVISSHLRISTGVIREGVFGMVRYPIYLSELLLYLGLLILNMSLAAGGVWLGAAVFLYYLSWYEERLLLKRFDEDNRSYMRDVGMWVPQLRRK
jgi:protein-S-isoprenylcysteine O-methyltransferase Ste14